ncbi:MAG: hypothetical protein PGMFKBFP_01266 [Anaerolineales bacterium]|nr:hypothetical protein [Anaerolineales bacterium]
MTLATEKPERLPVFVRVKSLWSTPVTSSEKVTVKSALRAEVGLAFARVMETTVGASLSTYSYAPISQCAPCGRATPRWSVAGQAASSPASIAAEPASRACVCVKPPLFASGPKLAL